ncbi:MAG: hypothetical protein CMJ90_04690 [Planctomycetes bacterium]|nr:hypothetical protein [Planctomycetota bacterium]
MGFSRVACLCVLLSLFPGCGVVGGEREPMPILSDSRATWVVRTQLTSRPRIDRVVEEAVAAGLNALIVQVRGRGDAYFQGGLEPPPPSLAETTFDPLAHLIAEAHGRGIAVHAWVNANLVWNPARPNNDPRHLVNRHPEWLMAPESLAGDLLALPPSHPDFKRRLLAYVVANPGSVEGLYSDPANEDYRKHLAAVCGDIAARYDVDGVHLDYIRYPNQAWGYSRGALDRFRVEVDRELSAEDRRDMSERLARHPLVYTRRYPVRWGNFRRRAVSRMVEQVSGAVRRARPGITVSAAVFPDISIARDDKLQEWPEWMTRGWLDVACPMNYATAEQRELFDRRTHAGVGARGPGRVWMGIGAWRLPVAETVARVRAARAAGANGVVLFSHGGLQGQRGAFTTLRREVFGPPTRVSQE